MPHPSVAFVYAYDMQPSRLVLSLSVSIWPFTIVTLFPFQEMRHDAAKYTCCVEIEGGGPVHAWDLREETTPTSCLFAWHHFIVCKLHTHHFCERTEEHL